MMKAGFPLRGSNLLQALKGFLQPEASLYHEAEAFKRLYQQTRTQVFRFLVGFSGGNLQDAEDLTSETYLRAWRKRDSFKGDEKTVLYWLLRIARNLTIDAHRRKKPTVTEEIELDHIADAESVSAEVLLEQEETRKTLHTLLQELSADAREILILRYTLGWSLKQISSYLGRPESTISVMIHRSLGRLQSNWSIRKEKENENA